MTYDVIVIGGGLAGCSTATHLARAGRRVLLLEKQRYPAHKLCGEFLSVEVQGLFQRLGVLGAVEAAGAHPIRHAVLTTLDGPTFETELPGTALGLSRFRMDELLARHAQAAGADVRDATPVRSVVGTLEDGFQVEAGGEHFEARTVVGAYGKRGTLDRKLDRPFLQQQSPFVGFKAHFRGPDLSGRIELHSFPGGYCGMSHVEDELINVCWIGRVASLQEAGGRPEDMAEAILMQNAALAARLRAMEQVSEQFLAVSQVQFAPKTPWASDVCMVGDTAGMIAPMCGDGMAMALRAAEVAAPRLDRFLVGELMASELREAYAGAWRREFGLRMRLGRWLHHAYARPRVSRLGVAACRRLPRLGRWFVEHTRG